MTQEKDIGCPQECSCFLCLFTTQCSQFGSGVAVAALVAAGNRDDDHTVTLLRQERQGAAGIIFSVIGMGSKDQYSFHI